MHTEEQAQVEEQYIKELQKAANASAKLKEAEEGQVRSRSIANWYPVSLLPSLPSQEIIDAHLGHQATR